MATIQTAPAERQPARRPAAPPSPADRLDAVADRIGRLGYGARGPEDFVVEKLSLERKVRRLAREART